VIAALFVEKTGIYSTFDNVDVGDVERDARNYAGPWPVVAHPPCQLWVNFAALNYKRYGGEHNRPGNDGGCFASALASVRKWGGVIEHPAGSKAFASHGLVTPSCHQWNVTGIDGEYTCEVWQSAYGHAARKRTWLYYVGKRMPFELDWRREPGTHQVGWFDRAKPVLKKREAIATPPRFAEALISLAEAA